MEKSEASKYFEENHYVKIANFITPEQASFLYSYVKLAAYRCSYLEYSTKTFDENVYGTFKDKQALGDYSQYGDLIFDTLLSAKLSEIEFLTGKKLTPTYSYYRLYTKTTELVRHKDRPSCEISTTLCLGYDVSNIDSNINPDFDWPMFVGPKNGEEGTIGTPIHTKPGDMIIYRGCELEHWREPFIGLNHAQVFLHYNDSNGQNVKLYDGRPTLGLPGNFKS